MTTTPASLSLAASLHPPARSWGEAGRLLVPGVWSLPGVLPGKEHSTKNPTKKRPRIGGSQPLGRVPPLVAVQTSQKPDVPSASRNGLGPGRQAGTGPCWLRSTNQITELPTPSVFNCSKALPVSLFLQEMEHW